MASEPNFTWPLRSQSRPPSFPAFPARFDAHWQKNVSREQSRVVIGNRPGYHRVTRFGPGNGLIRGIDSPNSPRFHGKAASMSEKSASDKVNQNRRASDTSSDKGAAGRRASDQQRAEADPVLHVDRRATVDRRHINDRRKKTIPVAFERRSGVDRRHVERRRQVDPTTCERDYTNDEIEFMRAMDTYKRLSGRQFPTWSEVLEVLYSMGYRRVAEVTPLPGQPGSINRQQQQEAGKKTS